MDIQTVHGIREAQWPLQVWSSLCVAFGVTLDRQASTSVQYVPQYQDADGCAAYREKPHQKRDAYIEEGTSYAQVAHKKFTPLPPLTFNACWWIMTWCWEALDALYRDDTKVPPPPGGKHAVPRERFCKKNVVRFGQEDKDCLGLRLGGSTQCQGKDSARRMWSDSAKKTKIAWAG
eukprot:s5368_g3.t1